MQLIRPATEEEVKSIADSADLSDGTVVVALDTPKGPILAVLRYPVEVDPVVFPEGCDNRQKFIFMRDVATGLKWQGRASFYFNIKADDAEWLQTAEKWGAERVSEAPEYRLKKAL